MSRTDCTVDRSLLSLFRENLQAIGVESTTVSSAEVEAELESRLEHPTVASPLGDGIELPENVSLEPTMDELKAAKTGLTRARLGVASLGSIVVPSGPELDGPVSLYPPKHVAMLAADDIVPDIATALEKLSKTFENGENDVVFVTGPSSTGDMGELVVGVHGPGEMEVVIVE